MGIIVGLGIVAYMWYAGYEFFWIGALLLVQFIFSVFTGGMDPGIGSLLAFLAAVMANLGGN